MSVGIDPLYCDTEQLERGADFSPRFFYCPARVFYHDLRYSLRSEAASFQRSWTGVSAAWKAASEIIWGLRLSI